MISFHPSAHLAGALALGQGSGACSVLGSGSAGAAEPVSSAEGDSAGCCHRGVDGAVPVPVGCWISEPVLSTACGTDVHSDFHKSEAEMCE